MKVVEASIAELREALETGETTSVGLVAAYLNRIAFYDRHGIALNAVPVLNPDMFADARAADLRRARGETLGPLDGIPYTAKDSYKVKGLSVASGSPAFADLIATEDAFAISRLRAAGAVLIGLTNMPPMANGGMQRGVYGRAESPYNPDWLTAAFGSGSSNGSGTSTAASFGAFGLGEETWSSGRAPAANNGLCAYTPSRGVISVRGNWPLVPTMDVVVPHSRSMADMLELLDIIVADDPETRGDLWRRQTWIAIPKASEIRPRSYMDIAATASLSGKRFGLPAMYINADPQAGTGEKVGIGGATGQKIATRASMIVLCNAARAALEAAGAEVVVTDFPVVSNYEGDRPGAPTIATRGLVSADYLHREIVDLSAWSWDDFLAANADPKLSRLADVDGSRIFPSPKGSLPDRYHGFDDHIADYPAHRRNHGVASFEDIPGLAEGFRGLEETRRIDLEAWMDELGLDAVIFPAVADIGPADADVNPASADLAWQNGTWVANGNLAIRHFGIPTVTVPMGMLADIGMPAGLTFAGRAWDDTALLAYACAFEKTGAYREAPTRTPELQDLSTAAATGPTDTAELRLSVSLVPIEHGRQRLSIQLQSTMPLSWLTVNGQPVAFRQEGVEVSASLDLDDNTHIHSEWRAPYGHIVIACANGQAVFASLGGTA
ncbi:amidase [Shinella sp. WSJ-2]|uniref:amidase n=1 Tax=Shinella sp. WSJ-2 TaxID=2303749 RepID=UPI000E3E4CB6|nr:amidase [Shinella sp. WSJ-2]RFZ87310.1 amidase [Shinella sp. WSJ-2]